MKFRVEHDALADAVNWNLCTPGFLEERLRQQWQAHASTGRVPLPAVQLTLPQLNVERALGGYGRALDQAGQEPA